MLVTKINNGLCPVRLYKSSYNNPNCINYAASNLTPPMNNLSAAYFIPFGISHKTDFKETINYADSSQKELELVRDKKSGRIIDAKVFRYNGTLDKHFKYDRATGNKIFYAKYFNDGKTREYFYKWNPKTGKQTEVLKYNKNGSLKQRSFYREDNGSLYFVECYDEDTNDFFSTIWYDKNGRVKQIDSSE